MGSVALVTGAAHGIGLEVCRQLVSEGWTVYLSARSLNKATDAAATIGSATGVVRPLALDVTDPAGIDAAQRVVDTESGRLDVLINNAAAYADWQEVASAAKLDRAREVIETNLMGAWRTTQAFLPLLRRGNSPRIVMVASGAGSHADPQFGLATNPGSATYAVSKAALLALTSKLAVELAPEHIDVNAACPGLTATAPGMEAMGARPVADGARSVVLVAKLPVGRTGEFLRDGSPVPW